MSSGRFIVLRRYRRNLQQNLSVRWTTAFSGSTTNPSTRPDSSTWSCHSWPGRPLASSGPIPCASRGFQKCSLHTTHMWQQQKGNEPMGEEDAPVKFSASSAHDYKSIQTFTIDKSRQPWYQPYSIWISTVVFLIYFLYLREENDLDEEMGKSIFERVPGLEEQHLIGRIRYFKSQGVDTTELQQRLEEILLTRQIQERQLAEVEKHK